MSNPTETLRVVTRVVRGQDTSDGAGVRLKRVIGTPGFDHVDPFLLLDEFKSDSSADYIAGFPDHPHRGFETVTYMLAGSMEHRDHIGNKGLLRAGSAQWMTAGHGIIHSEMPKQEHGLMWGFQLWVNLPARDKLCPPRYQDIAPEAIPEVALGDAGSARVVAGECNGVSGAVNGISVAPLYLDVTLKADATCSLPIPSGHTAFLYVYEGAARVEAPVAEDSRNLRAGELGLLGAGDGVRVTASSTAARFLLVAGRPLREPVARYGPFVMNTREEIVQAVDDFRNGRLLA
jgi:redox-sensitive bicupin YhaK (pirin superfamily)